MYINVLWVAVFLLVFFAVVIYKNYRQGAISASTLEGGIARRTLCISFQRLASEITLDRDSCRVNPSWFTILEVSHGKVSGWAWVRTPDRNRFIARFAGAEVYRAIVRLRDGNPVVLVALKDTANILISSGLAERFGAGLKFEEGDSNLLSFPNRKVS